MIGNSTHDTRSDSYQLSNRPGIICFEFPFVYRLCNYNTSEVKKKRKTAQQVQEVFEIQNRDFSTDYSPKHNIRKRKPDDNISTNALHLLKDENLVFSFQCKYSISHPSKFQPLSYPHIFIEETLYKLTD